jgi:hypothetical protein
MRVSTFDNPNSVQNQIKRLEMERDRYDAKYETSRYEEMIGFEFKGSFIEEQENRDEIIRLNNLF